MLRGKVVNTRLLVAEPSRATCLILSIYYNILQEYFAPSPLANIGAALPFLPENSREALVLMMNFIKTNKKLVT